MLGQAPARATVEHGKLSGRVLDPEGKSVSGVLVALSRVEVETTVPSLSKTTTTDANGAYSFVSDEAASVSVAVKLDAGSEFFAPPPIRTTAPPDREATGLDFRLARGLCVVGFVDSNSSEPIEGAVVRAQVLDEGALRGHMAYTDPTGYFEISGIHPGVKSVRIQAGAEGYRWVSYEPRLPFHQMESITLHKLAQLTIQATDAALSAPVRRFRYRLATKQLGIGEQSYMKWTEGSIIEKRGEAHISDVPPGEWQVTIEELSDVGNPTGRRADARVTLTGGNDIVRLSVGITKSVYGVVIDSSHNRISDRQVSIYRYDILRPEGEPVDSVVSAPDGTFEFQKLPPGAYLLKVVTYRQEQAGPILIDVSDLGDPEPVLIQLTGIAG